MLAAEGSQVRGLLSSFDAFSDYIEIEGRRQRDHALGNSLVAWVHRNVLDKRAVDLERIDRKLLEVAQVGIARTEVVDGQSHAEIL